MWTALSVILACAWITMAAPQGSPAPPVEIIASSSNVNADGSFNYSFEAGNGIKFSESGYLKPGLGLRSGAPGEDGEGENGDVQVVEGSYSYTAPDGTPISLSYTADDTGFHATGDHIPTPPPIPEAIQRALSLLPTDSSDSSGAASAPVARTSAVPVPAAAAPTAQEFTPSN